jgi:tRNA-splicing ligase RtcB
MGLNFGGNHFLEVQVVDRILDPASAREWGLARDQVVVMYHLGPGPFSGTLLHHFSRREKLAAARVPGLFLSKLLFHYGQRAGRGSARKTWDLHFRRNRWTVYRPESEEGLLIRQALAMATNFGFAYRLATVAAIRDAWIEAVSSRTRIELLCDVSHNSLFEESGGHRPTWVARHNACRLTRGGPAIVAGAHDVPSFLGRAAEDGPEDLHSYDHGAGHLIDAWRRAGRFGRVADGTTIGLRMTRGRHGCIRERGEAPVRSSEPITRLMECFEGLGAMHSVARLRPLGTLKN